MDANVTAIGNTDNDLPVESVDARPSESRWGKTFEIIFGGAGSWLRKRFGNRRVASSEVLTSNGLATVAKMPVESDALYYNFNHPKRGSAIIFNHEYFDDQSLGRRSGTCVDRDNLRDTLEHLGFDVSIYNDPTKEEIISKIIEVAGSDHGDCDCLLVAVLSHGDKETVSAKDVPYRPEYLWMPFTADKCPSLAGKPKLFFIQACRGERYDHGITLSRTEVDGVPQTYRIPTQADFLIVFSSIPGYESKGSWFMQALCSELKSNGRHLDIMTLLTLVSQKVAINFESNPQNANSLSRYKKQIPCCTTMLTRLLRFNEK